MIRKTKRNTAVAILLTMLFSFASPIVANAETVITDPNIDNKTENVSEISKDSFLENNLDEIVDNEESVKDDSEESLEEKEFFTESEPIVEDLKDPYSAVIKEKNQKIYISPEKINDENVNYISDDFMNTIVIVTHKVVLEEKEYVLIISDDKELGWIDSEAVEEDFEEQNSKNIENSKNNNENLEVKEENNADNKVTEENTESATKAEQIEEENVKTDKIKNSVHTSASTQPRIQYRAYVQTLGWMDWVGDRGISGTNGQGLRMEAFQLKIDQSDIGVRYQTRSERGSWTNWLSSGKTGGTTDQKRQLEGVRFELTGNEAKNYDIYYRVHTKKFGWLPWAKNGEQAGTEGYSYRVESMQVSVLPKGDQSIDTSGSSYKSIQAPEVTYRSHVQTEGWLPWVSDRQVSGTSGKGLRMESFQLKIKEGFAGVRYQTLSENGNWSKWVSDGQTGGTTNEKRQLEAVRMELTGPNASTFDIYYRVHSEKLGWLPWAKNGEKSGTDGFDYRIESMQISVLPKGNTSIDTSGEPFKIPDTPKINYQTHVEKKGWQSWVSNGTLAGTSGEALRLEAIKLDISNFPVSGGIQYRTHIQSSGWSNYSSNGTQSGTVGNKKRLEAIEIQLTGELSNRFDVYYRTHIQSKGWLGWVRNGLSSGSEGLGLRMEAIQVKLVPKGKGEPVDSEAGFVRPPLIYLDSGHGGYESGAVSGGVQEKTINLQTARRIEKLLKDAGYRVKMSRTNDTRLSLSQRAQEANRLNADIFLSVHYNAFRGTSQGIETFYYNQSGSTNNSQANNPQRITNSRNLARNIHNNLLRRSGAVDRGVRTANFHVIRETKMPAVLLELGYMDHAGERAKVITSSYQQKLAQGVAEGVKQYFGD